MQHDLEGGALDSLDQVLRLEVVGKEEFDRTEPRLGGGRKAIEERQLGEQHRKIRRKSWHRGLRAQCDDRAGSRQRISSNSFTLVISGPIEMLVTRSRMNSSTTGT